ncbi:hypothetical protein [Bordetella genomosp. 1]|uniref:hypothetical protein n=1 Tax=Bordetella genomosp. 1 TaxID=1395607 RepID=UPI001140DC10|nr:hypothetical protein [Bordetella genomosp. 1]
MSGSGTVGPSFRCRARLGVTCARGRRGRFASPHPRREAILGRKRTIVGVVITVVYLVVGLWLGWEQRASLLEMKPNEVGDFLAGLTGPIALLWLILGYFQQGDELRQGTEALQLQAAELRQSVEQQRELVKVTTRQVDAQLKAFSSELDERRRAVLPLFDLAVVGGYGRGDEQQYVFRLANHGATVKQFIATFEGREKLPQTINRAVFEHGAEHKFELVDKTSNRQPLTMRLSFLDAGGHRGARAIRVEFGASELAMVNATKIFELKDEE